MFRKFIYCLLLLLCITGLGYTEGYVPKVGEVLEYKVVVKSVIRGAVQTIKVVSKGVYNGREVYNIRSEMTTIGLVKGLYDYSQVEDLVLDAEGLFPWFIKQEVKNGKNIKQEEVSFDYSRKIAVRLLSQNSGTQERTEFCLPDFVQDGLSLQFFLRKDQNINGPNKIFFYNNGLIAENSFEVMRINQPITLESGTFPRYCQIVDNVSQIKISIAETPERFPIAIKKITDFGAIEMKLFKIIEAPQ